MSLLKEKKTSYGALNTNYFLLHAKVEASYKQCNKCLEETKTQLIAAKSLHKSVFSVVAKKVSVTYSPDFLTVALVAAVILK